MRFLRIGSPVPGLEAQGGLGRVERIQEGLNCFFMTRERQVGPDFGEGFEDEAAGGDPGMGNGEFRGIHGEIIGIEDIDVDGPRRISGMVGGPAEAMFDFLELSEEFVRGERRFDLHAGVVEGAGSGFAVDGIGFVEAGDERGRLLVSEFTTDDFAGGAHVEFAWSGVGAQCQPVFHIDEFARGRSRGMISPSG
jgi:hypothetical protein